ncbi:MAG: UDP-N-acetylenolpyruvoylglucosamine reductase [Alphaproteobacteria bacterium]|nr:UDP-N-acetylenolpyruvoylglucosamine reductase [Alphaproteobacteria bacterium]MDB5741062.1 UDP-N-acetylenolpyruvoylglucosamine reductase [Alphaproteobacteria bacterium]
MMMTPVVGSGPCDMLPPVRGSLAHDAPLKDLVWFRAGGPAEILFRPADVEDLATFLAAKPADLCVSVIGVGSNLLVRDGGIPGAVVRLSSAFGKVTTDGLRVHAGAAALDGAVARAAADAGIAGLEFLRSVPGTIGGALKMNAGCYGREIKDIFVEATAIDGRGARVTLTADDMAFEYRKARGASDDLIFVEAVFEGTADEPVAIRARMEDLSANREASQPIKSRTGGSTFKNPPGHKAWQLVDEAGCRGLMIGAAQVSEKHTNFLINTGDATAADLEALGEEVRKRVLEKSGVTLEWEIKRVGVA